MQQTLFHQQWRRGGFDFEHGHHRPEFMSKRTPATRHSEEQHQTAFFEWCEKMAPREPRLLLWYAIPNGMLTQGIRYTAKDGKRKRYSPQAQKMKRTGLKPGIPDMCWPVAARGFHGLYIENKVNQNPLQPEQVKWSQLLRAEGYAVHTCWDWTEAVRLTVWYASLKAGRGGVAIPPGSIEQNVGHNALCGCDLVL